jgi:hypothetical protein
MIISLNSINCLIFYGDLMCMYEIGTEFLGYFHSLKKVSSRI